jgi:hypothetical protein
MKESSDLIIPVYLNQRVVFDLVAMLKGGIATVTKVSDAQKEASSVSGQASGGFGLSQALSSLLRVNLSVAASGAKEDKLEHAQSEERVHTPASLFFVLRGVLVEKQVLRQDSEGLTPEPGDFIEFSSALRRNPLIESLDSFSQLTSLVHAFVEPPKGQTGGKQAKEQQQNDLKRTQKQIESLANSLRSGDTLDLTSDRLASSYRAVVTLEAKYLNDPTLSDLVDGTFRVLAKVIRVVHENEGGISLIRKAALSRLPTHMMESFVEVFKQLESQQGLHCPKWSGRSRGQ